MPKHRLEEVAALPEVAVFGIGCHVPDYRLCWSLNKALGLQLARRRGDIVEQARGKELHYPVFHQPGPDDAIAWALIGNACGKRKLIAEAKQADFFLVADSAAAELERDLLARLRAAEFVLAAFPIAHAELRNGHKLLL